MREGIAPLVGGPQSLAPSVVVRPNPHAAHCRVCEDPACLCSPLQRLRCPRASMGVWPLNPRWGPPTARLMIVTWLGPRPRRRRTSPRTALPHSGCAPPPVETLHSALWLWR